MTNKEELNKILCETFRVEENQLPDLKFGSRNWDSIGHIKMVTELEEKFDISISPDDVMEMGTYEDIIKVLEKSCGVVF